MSFNTSTQNPHQNTARKVSSWLADTQTPATLFQHLSKEAEMGFLLESADGDKRLARFSMLAILPRLIARLQNGTWHIVDTDNKRQWDMAVDPTQKPMALLKALQEEYFP